MIEDLEKWKEMVEEIKLQPYQERLINELEKESTATEIEMKAEAAFAPLRGKIKLLPSNHSNHFKAFEHWNTTKEYLAGHACTFIDCPICQKPDFISEEEMKL